VDGLSPHSPGTLCKVGPLRLHSTGTRLTRQGRDNPPGPAHPNRSSFASCRSRRSPVLLGPQAFWHPGAEAGRDNARCMPHYLPETESSWSRLVQTFYLVSVLLLR
jgi:hypothetical protein